MKNKNVSDSFLNLNLDQLNHLTQLENTCSKIQCAWLSGYFWKIANEKPDVYSLKTNELNKKDFFVTIISASQTGNARTLSERLYKNFQNENINSRLIHALDYKFKKIKEEKIVILIISTQGEGEPPEEAISLYKFIMSKKAPKLDHLYYSVLALGDTSYDLFCQAGKDFDTRFKELGGKSLLNRLDCDIEYEDVYNQWSKELLISINNFTNINLNFSSKSFNKENKSISSLQTSYTKTNPAEAIVLTNQKITGRNSSKDIRHIEIDISNLNINYIPGDALGVWYKNDANLIKSILNSLSINISDKVKIKDNNITIFDALRDHFELTTNTKNIVKSYAKLIKSKFLNKIVSNSSDLHNYSIHTPLVDMINDHPSKLLPEQLITLLRPLTPRLYSISSSQSETYDEIHITVGVVKRLISGRLHFGGASGYLSQHLKPDDTIKIFIETNNNFRLPDNPNAPIIMISSGTGIAPFRAFIQQRDNDASKGKNWIFFGNPNFTEDFLYQIEWQQYIKKGLLTKMSLSWSQDQNYKIYIQDKMQEHGKEIWDWIEHGAYIYVCGNASKMAKDVEKTLLDIIVKNSSMSFEDADDFLNNLRLNKRYQRDVY